MNPRWFERADWPMDWEIQRRDDLMGAIGSLPSSKELSEVEMEGMALVIWSASNSGREEELARNRPASRKTSELELDRLIVLARQLADHIESMHRPAVDALWRESQGDIWNTVERIRSLSEAARCAWGEIEIQGSSRGAGRKVEAAEVADMAGHVFERVTGRRPTLTVAPDSGHVSGDWPNFLGRIFTALTIDASVPSQARVVIEKYQSRT